jgi:hypothetical protein
MGPFGGNLQYEGSSEVIVFLRWELIRALAHIANNIFNKAIHLNKAHGCAGFDVLWVADLSSVCQRTESAWTSH